MKYDYNIRTITNNGLTQVHVFEKNKLLETYEGDFEGVIKFIRHKEGIIDLNKIYDPNKWYQQ